MLESSAINDGRSMFAIFLTVLYVAAERFRGRDVVVGVTAIMVCFK